MIPKSVRILFKLLSGCLFFFYELVLNPSSILGKWSGCEVYNLGTGNGTSVLEMVAAFEKASGKVNKY